jgi:hypothetical protein
MSSTNSCSSRAQKAVLVYLGCGAIYSPQRLSSIDYAPFGFRSMYLFSFSDVLIVTEAT